MYQFKMIPCDRPGEVVTVTTGDSTLTLVIARHLSSPHVDVHREGQYAFTLTRYGDRQPFWGISQSPCAADDDQPPC